MISRRSSFFVIPAGSEFWNTKPPADWSPEEIQRLLTNSPWAKEAVVEMNFSAAGHSGAMGGMSRGRQGGMRGAGPEIPGITATVRWESALPVRQVSKRKLPASLDGQYVLSVTGLPVMDPSSVPRDEDLGGGELMFDRIREASTLQRRGKDTLGPTAVTSGAASGSFLLTFDPGSQPITAAEKEITFVTKMGPMSTKAKFLLKEMLYQGRLAL
jgi:hypothetical protein